ncbi:TPA_asm: hypothetical protein GND15_002381 [Salmonella enterica subsp. salamae serovar 58:d:z6]|uniref:Apea-like HEPN domain-containing protein n=1 Tax=Salmonella enterica subsp. salamae serovar 58:d:z6 TaxID=41517 RepID=A0A729AW90_SALER|nr:hypothetical protein [Salmonella enterica]ECG1420349.1 hypothetical protein [Salmonella enterica subsp. salamae str. CFSAN000559]QRR39383.1 hypothetical protein JQN60_04035 [Salmonella enterica subsp. enterica]HAE2716980.1 hypothetical protein [Salmonella enterica subsp. salamae serovar 58:d:z6]HAE2990875.1 hypothetical protein [Salmonella enterica subsp. salamae serovar 58:d:z6]HAE4546293.1 hypothetical protein [Salmonella enterica subsp. salamae serovar 58:d:z6]
MKAQEWLDRGRLTEDPMDAFSNYYRGLNHLFSSITNGSERDKIAHLLQENISNENAADILNTYSKNVENLISEPVIDMRGNGKNTGAYIDNFKSAKDNIEKLKNIFMIIYQIRCNFEHGQKSPNRKRDIYLCKNSLPLLDSAITASLKQSF